MSVSLLRRIPRASIAAPLAMLAVSLAAGAAKADPKTGPYDAPAATAMVQTSAPEAGAEAKPAAPKTIAVTLNADVDLTTQKMTVSSGGKTLHVWPISSGRQGYDTPRGSFRPQWAAKMHYSKQYDDAPMPHSVFFNGGIATHATQATGMLGRPASHGCVRLAPSAAATFYALVHKHGYQATRIVVRGAPKFREDMVASRRVRDRDEPRQRVAARPYPQPRYVVDGYGNVVPAYGYAPRVVYAPQAPYGYAQPRRVYMVPRGYAPAYGQVRYVPQGYVRY